MRVGLVIYGSLGTISGGYLYDRKLVEYLESRGDRVETVSLPWRNYARHLGDNYARWWIKRLRQLDVDVDVVLQDELVHPSLFRINRLLEGSRAGKERNRDQGAPRVAVVHHLRCSEKHPAWQKRIYREIETRYLKSIDGFVFNSQTTRREVESLVGEVRNSVVAYPAGNQLNPNITELEIIQRAAQPGPLRLLFLGNVIARKGLHVLLSALSKLATHQATLTVIGSMEADLGYARRIRRQISALDLQERVKFTGSLERADLASQVRQHHVLVVPSTYEGFGIAYLEGMGFGLPAVASTIGAAWEVINHAVDGLLLPAENPVQLAENLGKLSHDRQRLVEMSLAARRRYLAHPTWEQTGEQIRTFLLSMLR